MKHYFIRSIIVIFLISMVSPLGFPHIDGMPSVHDVITSIKKRLVKEHDPQKLLNFKEKQLIATLYDKERKVLSVGHIRFTVNEPVTVYVFSDIALENDPFWLETLEFTPTEYEIQVDDEHFKGWKKQYDAGRIGLGVNALHSDNEHYFVVLVPVDPSSDLTVSKLYPGQCRLAELGDEVEPWVDDGDEINSFPSELEGATLVRTAESWLEYASITDYYHSTRFPSSNKPDQIVLTWSDDPKSTQTIQWRTSTEVEKGMVAYVKKSDYNRFHSKTPTRVNANTELLETLDIINDQQCHRHSVTLTNLEPGTTYLYSVGDGSDEGWSEFAEFTTAPEKTIPFTFIYMGDAQNGLDRWGSLVKNAFRSRPDAKFYVMAGDLVNRGNERWDWDDFFWNARGIFDRRTLVPAIGNHENQNGHPKLYLDIFNLRENGPVSIEPERAYSFHYSNAFFVILDSNLEPADQTAWLESQLASTDATWKFVVYHHPAYTSKPNRDNPELRKEWTPLFDKYHVDMVLQGHDHAYLRTYPMKNEKPVDSPKDGTIYIVSVSGVKMYDQDERPYTAFGMTNVSTYQVLDIQIVGDRLLYRSYDIDGNLRDKIEIEK